jgi:hypothetical protein
MKKLQCECSDPGCPEHEGKSECTKQAKHMVRRIDFEGQPKCYFCQGCYEDAIESGVFA